MWQYDITSFSESLGVLPGVAMFAIILAAIWSLFWKGWALWVSARRTHKVWFIIILLVNTLGILEIIYLFLVAKAHKDSSDKGVML